VTAEPRRPRVMVVGVGWHLTSGISYYATVSGARTPWADGLIEVEK
jgi:hypothetical protein